MIVEETDIFDISVDNIDSSKVEFTNIFIEKIAPTIDLEYKNLSVKLDDLTEKNNQKKSSLLVNKSILEKLSSELKKRRKQERLVNIVYEICNNEKLMNNSEIRSHIKMVLRILDTLTEKKIDSYITNLETTLNKKKKIDLNQ
jgi:hypothetical protein